MAMDDYEKIPMGDDESAEGESGSMTPAEMGTALKKAISSGDGESICEWVKKIVAEDY